MAGLPEGGVGRAVDINGEGFVGEKYQLPVGAGDQSKGVGVFVQRKFAGVVESRIEFPARIEAVGDERASLQSRLGGENDELVAGGACDIDRLDDEVRLGDRAAEHACVGAIAVAIEADKFDDVFRLDRDDDVAVVHLHEPDGPSAGLVSHLGNAVSVESLVEHAGGGEAQDVGESVRRITGDDDFAVGLNEHSAEVAVELELAAGGEGGVERAVSVESNDGSARAGVAVGVEQRDDLAVITGGHRNHSVVAREHVDASETRLAEGGVEHSVVGVSREDRVGAPGQTRPGDSAGNEELAVGLARELRIDQLRAEVRESAGVAEGRVEITGGHEGAGFERFDAGEASVHIRCSE